MVSEHYIQKMFTEVSEAKQKHCITNAKKCPVERIAHQNNDVCDRPVDCVDCPLNGNKERCFMEAAKIYCPDCYEKSLTPTKEEAETECRACGYYTSPESKKGYEPCPGCSWVQEDPTQAVRLWLAPSNFCFMLQDK